MPAMPPRLLTALTLALACSPAPPALLGRAVLPAASFAAGPPSGAHLGATNIRGQSLPFASQPVQGFSALVDRGDGSLLALADNGYGAIENSADFHLRVYTIRPDFQTGSITVETFVELRDPNHHLAFPIVHHFSAERILTGADLDPESMQRAPDGTLWFGDEFGPFLIHTAADGVVLAPPIAVPDLDHPGLDLRAPQNPYNEEGAALRLMNALRWRASQRGAPRSPVFSPDHTMLLTTSPPANPTRDGDPPAGLAPAASRVFAAKSLRAAGFPVIPWTVNDPERMRALLQLGVDGIISDRPDLLLAALRAFDGDGDGAPDFITADGLVDAARFSAQGHRGARDLRPENTLPAMEAALDHLVTTLETDVGLTRDLVPLLAHDPTLAASKCRRGDGSPYTADDERLLRDATAAELQARFICDRLLRGPQQTHDRALSPVSLAFATTEALPDIYTPPTLAQLFRFVDAYADYYDSGPGAPHPDAALRARNARRVRFNVETKLSPRHDRDARGQVFAERTHGPEAFAAQVLASVTAADLAARVDVQSFDLRTLLQVQDAAPAVRTVVLLADFPRELGGDGANLQGEGDAASPWLAGLAWPYRVTTRTYPARVAPSGGLEGMALRHGPPALLPMLEKPLQGAAGELEIREFDLASERFTDRRWTYPLDPRATSIGEFTLDAAGRGLVIERDDSEGDLAGHKQIQRFELGPPGPVTGKHSPIDLLAIPDPHGLAPAQAGDVGLGDGRLALPYFTIESLCVLPGDRLLVGNDNNLPFGAGRHAGSQAADDSELVVIRLPD